ncbi:MG(2+) CHELATASE FAMILY PROTEIN / ComM-related protein [Shigella boydii ATCC 9905]|nr:MG(2+) CHELATASE FAMILY PROTEIN / ComM-related protein [Shigella boydii ATCC 9905]
MSLSIVHTRAALGVNAPPITVEVHISKGLPGLTMVGLPETTVKEARDRVRSAIINSGYEYPAKKITINLAPTDLPKEGGRYDLPIAIALLAASEQLTANKLDEYELVGEPRQPDGCKLKTAPVRPVVAARSAEYVCSEDLFY